MVSKPLTAASAPGAAWGMIRLRFGYLALSIRAMAKRKNPAAVALGKLGAKARLKKMTSEQRRAVAATAAAARWKDKTNCAIAQVAKEG